MEMTGVYDENQLEHLIGLAAKQPIYAPVFYSELIASSVFVLLDHEILPGEVPSIEVPSLKVSSSKAPSVEASSVTDDTEFLRWLEGGLPVLPCFTSLCCLREFLDEMVERKLIEAERNFSYRHIPVVDLFQMVAGMAVRVNPITDSGCVLMPDEIAYLLQPAVNMRKVNQISCAEDVSLSALASVPEILLTSLTHLFSKYQQVTRAYLASMDHSAIYRVPQVLVGVEAEGDIDELLCEASNCFGKTAVVEQNPLCFMNLTQSVSRESKAARFFAAELPFYERRWGQYMHVNFGVGKA